MSDPSNWHGEAPSDWLLVDTQPGQDATPDHRLEVESWECPHDAFEHPSRGTLPTCIFHTPPHELPDNIDEGEALLEALDRATEARDTEITRRRKQFIGANFGNLEIAAGTTIAADDDYPIRLTHARFSGDVDLSGVRIEPSLDARGCGFDSRFSNVDFSQTKFCTDDRVTFRESVFDVATVDFNRAEFDVGRSVIFTESEFGSRTVVDFSLSEFDVGGTVHFGNVDFGYRMIHFDQTTFNSGTGTIFWDAEFPDDTRFHFPNSTFSGEGDIYFRGLSFEGESDIAFNSATFDVEGDVSFAETTFGPKCQVTFEGADFIGQTISNGNFEGANFTRVKFIEANISNCSFYGADIDGALFGNSFIDETVDFLSIRDDTPNRPSRVDADPKFDTEAQSGLYQYIAAIRSYLPLRPQTSAGTELENDEDGRDDATRRYQKAARQYHLIETIGRDNSLPTLQAIGFVRRQDMHRQRYAEQAAAAPSLALRRWAKWVRASTARLVLLYGESPWRILITALSFVFGYAIMYSLSGLRVTDTGQILHASTIGDIPVVFPQALYFSTLTFTTLGFGNYQPVGWGRWAAISETALGAILAALLVFVLGRRAAR
ncbi:pentapeptide repeat-containing protein [Halobaculum halobium]|uniref:Pentapeptide repeat-containing protein n=1 Tax=Halobaculum halobium TaxID=3032281 RepID=A0ABD5T7T7_9EURY|nr:pentapeptide repeat-containing protein [Halobaculum sp. SYNS20]